MSHDLDQLRQELGDFAPTPKKSPESAREERIVAGFEAIQRFVEQQGHAPVYDPARDIFERLYAIRLQSLRQLPESRELLASLDHQGLLAEPEAEPAKLSEADLAAELAEFAEPASELAQLRHVRPKAEPQPAEHIAQRKPCDDFAEFAPYFEQVQRELQAGHRQTIRFGQDTHIEAGQFFILTGQLAYVAHVGETFHAPNGDKDARLRVIFSNRTESDMLLRSLQNALYKDKAGRRVTASDAGPLFSDQAADDDIASGTIYILRSQSSHPYIAQHRQLIHKIGVTGGTVANRIARAAHEPTYLLAEVKIVATYKLVGINRVKLENLLHQLFAPAQLDLTIQDRFGQPVKPREWYIVPLSVIEEAIRRIRDGSITQLVFDPKTASLIPQT